MMQITLRWDTMEWSMVQIDAHHDSAMMSV